MAEEEDIAVVAVHDHVPALVHVIDVDARDLVHDLATVADEGVALRNHLAASHHAPLEVARVHDPAPEADHAQASAAQRRTRLIPALRLRLQLSCRRPNPYYQRQ